MEVVVYEIKPTASVCINPLWVEVNLSFFININWYKHWAPFSSKEINSLIFWRVFEKLAWCICFVFATGMIEKYCAVMKSFSRGLFFDKESRENVRVSIPIKIFHSNPSLKMLITAFQKWLFTHGICYVYYLKILWLGKRLC